MTFFDDFHSLAQSLAQIAHDFHRFVNVTVGAEASGLAVGWGTPTERKGGDMPNVKVFKKSQIKRGAAPGGKAVKGDLAIVDNEDNTYSLSGLDAGGNPVPITGTHTASSSDSSIITVTPNADLTGSVSALKPGSATLSFAATLADGTTLNIDEPVSVTAGPANKLVVTWGTPTVRP